MTIPSVLLVALCVCAASVYGQAAAPPAGVGIAIATGANGELIIAGVKPDGPAARAGIVAGDVLVAVENQPVAQIGIAGIPGVVSGAAGTSVNLTIATPGQPARQVRVQREAGIAVRPPDPNAPADAPQPGGSQPNAAAPNPFDPNLGAQAPPQPAAPQPATPPPAGARTLKLRPFVIRDPAVNNVVACAPLVPEGWQAKGDVVWFPEHAILANLRLEITDPQTAAGVRWLPAQHFVFMQNPPGQVAIGGNYQGRLWVPPPRDAAEVVQTFFANDLPELRGLQPTARQEFPVQSQRLLRQMLGNGPRGQETASVQRLRYRVEQGGRGWDEDVYLSVGFSPNPAIGAIKWFVTGASVARAPAGEIDRMPVLSVVRGSAEMTPIGRRGCGS